MKRFKNILVAYDDAIGGDDAIGQGIALAGNNGARLTLAVIVRSHELVPAKLTEFQKRLARLEESVRESGVVDVDSVILDGTPAPRIIKEVADGDHDLVIASIEAGNGMREKMLGSTATQLMRKCPCPVWVIKPGQPVPYRRILAAVDPFASDEGVVGMNQKILDLAVSLSIRDRAVLSVVHAWDVTGKDLDTIRSETNAAQREEILERHERMHDSALKELLGRCALDEVDHQIHLPRASAATAIGDLATELSIDLIVMGTQSRPRLSGFLAGHTAEEVIGAVDCGLLVAKPDSFADVIGARAPSKAAGEMAESRDVA